MKPIQYITVLLFTIAVLLCVLEAERNKTDAILTNQQNTITQFGAVISNLQTEAAAATEQIDELNTQVSVMRETMDKQSRGGERLISLGMWKRTGYCSCQLCCGKWALNRPNGIVYGRDGKTELIEGVSVAADLPFGTKLMIDGTIYTVHDIPAENIIEANGGKIVDLYCGSDHGKAWSVGNEHVEVFLVEKRL